MAGPVNASDTNVEGIIEFRLCMSADLYQVTVIGGGSTNAGHCAIYMFRAKSVVNECQIYKTWVAVYCADGSSAYVRNSIGNSNGTSIGVYRSSTMYVYGYAPYASDDAYNESGFLYPPENEVPLSTGTGSTPTVTPVETKTVELALSATRTNYGGSSWYDGTNLVAQGATSDGGVYKGCMWFNLSPLDGKTIKTAQIKLFRKAGIGSSSRINVYIGWTTRTGPSGSITTSNSTKYAAIIGQCEKETQMRVTIPASIMQGLVDWYTTYGLTGALFVWSDNASDYGAFDGYGDAHPPKLAVAYEA